MLKRKNGMNPFLMIGLVVLAVFGVMALFGGDKVSNPLSAVTTDSTSTTAGIESCRVTGSTAITYQLMQKENPTRQIDLAPDYAIVNGGGASTSAPSTASVGDKIQIMFANSSAYGKIVEFTVPCAPTYLVNELTPYNNVTAISQKLFNEDGDIMTNSLSGSTNATIGSGGSATLDLKLTGVNDEGHPQGIVLVEYPTAKFSASDVVVNLGGSKVTCPSFYTASATSQSFVCYSIGDIVNTESISGTLSLRAKSGQDPAQADRFRLVQYAEDVYYDESSNSFKMGVEDEDGTQVSPIAQTYFFGVN